MHHPPRETAWRQLVPGDYVQDPDGTWYFVISAEQMRFELLAKSGQRLRVVRRADETTIAATVDDSEAITALCKVLPAAFVEGALPVFPAVTEATSMHWLREHLEHVHGISLPDSDSIHEALAAHEADTSPLVPHVHRSL